MPHLPAHPRRYAAPSTLHAATTAGLALCAVLSAALLPATAGATEAYPAKPIRLIIPFAPGQGADSAARVVATKLADQLKVTIIPDNRPGAGGNIGTEAAAKAAPDGYTLLVGSNGTHAANQTLYKSLRFDPLNDFAPISYIGNVAMVMLAAPNFPVNNMTDLIKAARAQPGQLSVAIPSSTARVVLELITSLSNTRWKDVPYKASAAATTDLIGGHVQLSIDTALAAVPQVNGGRLKALGVSTAQRTAVLPNAGTFAEAIPGFDIAAWNVWLAPKGTPPEIVERLNREIRTVLADADVKARLRSQGYEPSGTESPAQVAAFLRAETRRWGDLIRSAGLKEE